MTDGAENLYEVALTARDFFSRFPKVLPDPPSLVTDVVRGVSEAVEETANVQVVIAKPYTEMVHLDSMLVRYRDRAVITPAGRLNRCWKRFAICKELAHVLRDKPSHYTKNVADTIIAAHRPRALPAVEEPLDSETFAKYLAYELMIPFQFRPQANALRPSGLKAIAHAFLVPEMIVEEFYVHGYAELSAEANSPLHVDPVRPENP